LCVVSVVCCQVEVCVLSVLCVVRGVCWQVEVSAPGWLLVQRGPTESGVSWVWSWTLYSEEATAHRKVHSLHRYRGRFIMCFGITKIYDRKTVGHVLTKPVHVEEVAFHRTSHFWRCVSVQAEIKWSPINRWRWRCTGSGQFWHSPKKKNNGNCS
jgi:hypothetical protein